MPGLVDSGIVELIVKFRMSGTHGHHFHWQRYAPSGEKVDPCQVSHRNCKLLLIQGIHGCDHSAENTRPESVELRHIAGKGGHAPRTVLFYRDEISVGDPNGGYLIGDGAIQRLRNRIGHLCRGHSVQDRMQPDFQVSDEEERKAHPEQSAEQQSMRLSGLGRSPSPESGKSPSVPSPHI